MIIPSFQYNQQSPMRHDNSTVVAMSASPRIRRCSKKWSQFAVSCSRIGHLITLLLALHSNIGRSSASSTIDLLTAPPRISATTRNWRVPIKLVRRSRCDDSTLSIEKDDESVSTEGSTAISPSKVPITKRWRAGALVVVHGSTTTTSTGLSYYGRVALAGGLAGATGTTVLYPMDSAKTLRQSNPTQFSSVRQALWHLIRSPAPAAGSGPKTTTTATWQFSKAYRGWLPAALGAIPSSALYFGAYESSKRALEQRFGTIDEDGTKQSKWWIHGLAAASGNTISSAVFVPKEVLKQQLQYQTSSSPSSAFPQVFVKILREKGVRGLYTGYQATLMRNIPSAMVRFILYEELKRLWSTTHNNLEASRLQQMIPEPVGLFAAGAIAGAAASGFMTPIDVIKTRLATGTCPVGVQNCFRHVLQEMGWRGLYVGAGSRMVWSGAFSAIGFGTFELVKGALGVSNSATGVSTATATTPSERKTK